MTNEEWRADALHYLHKYKKVLIKKHMREFLWSGFHEWAVKNGLEEPNHPNSWGSLTQVAVSDGLIEGTGKFVSSSRPSNHGSVQQIWVLSAD